MKSRVIDAAELGRRRVELWKDQIYRAMWNAEINQAQADFRVAVALAGRAVTPIKTACSAALQKREGK